MVLLRTVAAIHPLRSTEDPGLVTDQSSEDEEDHEETTENRGAEDVTVADRGHRHQSEIDALPVRQPVNVLEVVKRIARVFHLQTQHIRFQ